jgi:hypothetical protein
MALFWWLMTPIVIALAIVTIVDVFRTHHRGWNAAGWVLLIVVLPIVGPVIYMVRRKPSRADAEQAYLLDADRRGRAAHQPPDW